MCPKAQGWPIGLPWDSRQTYHPTPNGVVSLTSRRAEQEHNTRWGWWLFGGGTQGRRSTGSHQPWALGRNPVGIRAPCCFLDPKLQHGNEGDCYPFGGSHLDGAIPAFNPKGIVSQSPGLADRPTLGLPSTYHTTPTGLCPSRLAALSRNTTPVGVAGFSGGGTQGRRWSGSHQLWALGWNPVGILARPGIVFVFLISRAASGRNKLNFPLLPQSLT